MRQHPKPAKAKVEAKSLSSASRKRPGDSSVPDLKKRLAEAVEREAKALRREAEAREQLQTRDRELAEAREQLTAANAQVTESLEQQTATSEILRVIGSSPTDAQPAFDAIVQSGLRLLGGHSAVMLLVRDDRFHLAAYTSTTAEGDNSVAYAFPAPVGDWPAGHRAVLELRPVVVEDAEREPGVTAAMRETIRARGWRSSLAMPMIKGADAIGLVNITRREPGSFAADEIALLQTFAEQAVIAIENVRLFKELEEKNRALTEAHAHVSEALEQQTATSQVLGVISQSQTDVQPVFEAIVESAARLCEGLFGTLFSFDGELIHLVAAHNWTPAVFEAARRVFPTQPTRATATGRAILERAVVHVPDVDLDPEWETGHEASRVVGFRSALCVPMLRDGVPLGVIGVARANPGPFSDKQVALLKTFADQAVIAIENVRLFRELEARNRELTESLEQQTATGDILRVISSSPTDVQPVFDTIAARAKRLCDARECAVFRFDGELIHLVAQADTSAAWSNALRGAYPRPPGRGMITARAIQAGSLVHVPDVLADPEFELTDAARVSSVRSTLSVPMIREGQVIGAITVDRREPKPFLDKQIGLVRIFADQAVIAIENVRLFKELEARTAALTRSVGELRALGAVGQALSSTLDVDVVLDTIVTRANDLIGADGCTIFEYDEVTEQFHLRATRNLEPRLVELARGTPLRKGDQGILGQLPMERQAVQVPDITAGSYSSPISDALIEAGYRAVVAVPLIREEHLIGALTMNRKTPGDFPHETIELLQTFATQSALAIQNARLFREIEAKSRELEVASQHKSEFLANMSHELRTPLNAIIGFSEVLSERMFGDLNEKQEEYLKDIYASGTHLLSLINDILDLSKIEAGRMELELTEFDLPTAIENALMLVRERAGRRSIALHTNIDNRLGQIQADERKVRQVVLNLLSNAIKFTPEGGRIDVEAVPKDGSVEISVSDTGIGIAPEDQEKVFEEFRQVGTAAKKVEGTGLGLTLCRKFVDLHGGKIWVTSQLGVGSTFTFTIPVPVANESQELADDPAV
jgi:signal transduction histidine kinase